MGKKSYSIEDILSKKIKLVEYSSFDDETKQAIELIVDCVKASSILKVGIREVKPIVESLWSLKWIELIELRDAMNDNDLQTIFSIVYNLKENDFVNLELINTVAVQRFIVSELEGITNAEKNKFQKPTQKEMNAGVEKLQDFEYTPMVDMLAGGQLWKHEEILQMNYAVVFRKICLDQVNNEIQRNYVSE